MKTIIISDIHRNLEALKKALEYNDKQECEKCVVCLGDIVGYGPDPAECFNIVTYITDKICLGNQEDAVIDTHYDYQINMYARDAIKWTRNILNNEIKNVIEKLPLEITEDNVLYVHTSPDDPMIWKYITNDKNAYSSSIEMEHSLCFV